MIGLKQSFFLIDKTTVLKPEKEDYFVRGGGLGKDGDSGRRRNLFVNQQLPTRGTKDTPYSERQYTVKKVPNTAHPPVPQPLPTTFLSSSLTVKVVSRSFLLLRGPEINSRSPPNT